MSESRLGESPYNCPECDAGEDVCDCCGHVCECIDCDGTGWDAEQVDIEAFKAAVAAMEEKARVAGAYPLGHEWIVLGQRLGRKSEFGSVAVADYLLERKE
jgi:hypothetical protein